MHKNHRTILLYLILLSASFVVSFIVFLVSHSYFSDLIVKLDNKTDNLYAQEKILTYMENELSLIRSKFFEMSASTTNKMGVKLLYREIKDNISYIKDDLNTLENGSVLEKNLFNKEVIKYKTDFSLKDSMKFNEIRMNLNYLEDVINKSKTFLFIKNKFLRERNEEYIRISKQIIRINKTMPSIFGRIMKNIDDLKVLTNKKIKFYKDQIQDKKSLYTKLELIPIFANMIILIFLTILIDRRILRLSKKITRKSQKLQDVLDAQENIVILTNGEKISMYNQYFTEFFSDEVVEKVRQTNDCICKYFLDKEGYFSLSKIKDNQSWIEYLKNKEEKYRVVCMLNKDSQERYFSVIIKEFKNKEYVISLTDITDIQTESKRYEKLAMYDNLTKIYNRQKFNEIFEYELKKQERYKEGLSIVMFDLDHFKKVNDIYGHNIGDEVLKNVSKTVSKMIRKQDTFARWGGEEFMLLLPHTDCEEAYIATEKIRKAIEEINIPNIPKVTASFGMLSCNDLKDMTQIISMVDSALYRAKESGRNIVVKYYDKELVVA